MDLMLIEEQVKSFVVIQPKLSSNEKTKRIVKTLDFITDMYNKNGEEIPADEAYTVLFGDENV